jgi:hypothetical protein
MPTAPQNTQTLEKMTREYPMKSLNLKVPEDVPEKLRLRAKRIQCHMPALGRALLIKGLRKLPETDGPDWL